MIIISKANFNRPANTTAYVDNDLIANDTNAVNVIPLIFSVARLTTGRGVIRRIRFYKDDETATAATFNLHLFERDPSVNVGDNAQLDNSGTFAVDTSRYYLGVIAMDCSSGAFLTSSDLSKNFPLTNPFQFDLFEVGQAERRLYGLLEAGAAYNPASGELFEIALEISSEA